MQTGQHSMQGLGVFWKHILLLMKNFGAVLNIL